MKSIDSSRPYYRFYPARFALVGSIGLPPISSFFKGEVAWYTQVPTANHTIPTDGTWQFQSDYTAPRAAEPDASSLIANIIDDSMKRRLVDPTFESGRKRTALSSNICGKHTFRSASTTQATMSNAQWTSPGGQSGRSKSDADQKRSRPADQVFSAADPVKAPRFAELTSTPRLSMMDIMQYNEELTKQAGIEEEPVPAKGDLKDEGGCWTGGSSY